MFSVNGRIVHFRDGSIVAIENWLLHNDVGGSCDILSGGGSCCSAGLAPFAVQSWNSWIVLRILDDNFKIISDAFNNSWLFCFPLFFG